jgi:hypothetical protein
LPLSSITTKRASDAEYHQKADAPSLIVGTLCTRHLLIDLPTQRLQDHNSIAENKMRIDNLPKASVAIHVNGSALHEHMAESEHPMVATSYVETVSGAEFSVVLKLEPRFRLRDKSQALVCAIPLDGQEVMRHLYREQHMRHGYTDCIDNALDDLDGVTYSRKFTFAQHASSNYVAIITHTELANPA